MDTRELQLFLSLSETLHFGQTGEALHNEADGSERGEACRKVEARRPALETNARHAAWGWAGHGHEHGREC